MQNQSQDDQLSRALVVSEGETFSGTLPPKTSMKGYTIQFNPSTGEPERGPSVADISSAGANATAAAASAAAAATSEANAAGSVAAFANAYTFSSTVTMADPGAGILRFNNATVTAVTAIAIDATSADTGNPDLSAWIAAFGSGTSTSKCQLKLFVDGTPVNFAIFDITAVVDTPAGCN